MQSVRIYMHDKVLGLDDTLTRSISAKRSEATTPKEPLSRQEFSGKMLKNTNLDLNDLLALN